MKYCCLQLFPICSVEVLLTTSVIMRMAKVITSPKERSVSNVILCGVLYFSHIFAFVSEQKHAVTDETLIKR
jgi:hypothetical protein